MTLQELAEKFATNHYKLTQYSGYGWEDLLELPVHSTKIDVEYLDIHLGTDASEAVAVDKTDTIELSTEGIITVYTEAEISLQFQLIK